MAGALPMWPQYPEHFDDYDAARGRLLRPAAPADGIMPRRDIGYNPYQNATYYRDEYVRQRGPVPRAPLPRRPAPVQQNYYRRSRSVSSDSSYSSRSRSRNSSRDRSRSRSRSRSPSPPKYTPQNDPDRPRDKYTIMKAAKCAALGAGLEGFRARNEPGPWMGRKGARLALAAASSIAVGSLRHGSLTSAGFLPYAEALCTGFFAVEWYKKIGRDTHHEEEAYKEQAKWRAEKKSTGRSSKR